MSDPIGISPAAGGRATIGRQCKHCRRPVAKAHSRGLCRTCHGKPAVRGLHPQERRSGLRGDGVGPSRATNVYVCDHCGDEHVRRRARYGGKMEPMPPGWRRWLADAARLVPFDATRCGEMIVECPDCAIAWDLANGPPLPARESAA